MKGAIDMLRDVMPTVANIKPKGSWSDINTALMAVGTKSDQAMYRLVQLHLAAKDCGLELTTSDLPLAVRRLSSGLPVFFKGVSYNPNNEAGTNEYREWLLLIDFISLMKSITTRLSSDIPRFVVLDAGLYWVVNRIDSARIAPTSPSPEQAAKEMIASIREEVINYQGQSVLETCRVRNAYLRALVSLFPEKDSIATPTLLDVWSDKRFVEYLAIALQRYCHYDGRRWRVIRAVHFDHHGPYSLWVTPLIAAEFSVLASNGVTGYLTPTAEARWNKVVNGMCQSSNLPSFLSLFYLRRIGRGSTYEDMPWFSDTREVLQKKVECMSFGQQQALSQLIKPLYRSVDETDLADGIYSFCRHVKGLASEIYASGINPSTAVYLPFH